jgi:hypothetical protein
VGQRGQNFGVSGLVDVGVPAAAPAAPERRGR